MAEGGPRRNGPVNGAPVACPPRPGLASDPMDSSLTGLWSGLYSYPVQLRPVFFVASLISHGAGFSGLVQEAPESVPGTPVSVAASLHGTQALGRVEFTKTYDGTGGWRHAVLYAGRLSADRTEIEGRWRIPGSWGGRFLMVRGERAEEAAMREAFERA